MKSKVYKVCFRAVIIIFAILLLTAIFIFLSQGFYAHRKGQFVPDYPMVELNEQTDYETIFLQTGLGRPAAELLLDKGDFDSLNRVQQLFFNPPKVNCSSFLGLLTREDILSEPGPNFVDLKPGDILLTLSTHSFGWRHGHAGLVIDDEYVLEAAVMGERAEINPINSWNSYSTYAVLRVKSADEDKVNDVLRFGVNELRGKPYSLTAGFIGKKAPKTNSPLFSVHCSYLVWYAWQHFGYDLDSDNGRLVSTSDLLNSDLVEIVQLYGIDPKEFLNK